MKQAHFNKNTNKHKNNRMWFLFRQFMSHCFRVKAVFFVAAFLLLVTACNSEDEINKNTVFQEDIKYIILMHPTVFNIERYQFLTESGVFPLPAKYQAVGVYHKSGSYNYERSYEYINENSLSNVSLLGLEEELRIEDLYGENVLSSAFRNIFENSEGIIFFGGPDIPPVVYGYETNLLTVITDPHRHYLEISFLFHLLGGSQNEKFVPLLEEKPDFRILGICLGMQSMNVSTGGTMYQDIPTEIYNLTFVEDVLRQDIDLRHRNYYNALKVDKNIESDTYHKISIDSGSIMEKIAGGSDISPYVLSSHHQALKEMGKGWRITATSADGMIVEAIEHNKYPNVFGVQFHPEIINLYKDEALYLVPGDESGLTYFESFPKEKGEYFHKSFWKYFAGLFP